jgi:hypothetical protein
LTVEPPAPAPSRRAQRAATTSPSRRSPWPFVAAGVAVLAIVVVAGVLLFRDGGSLLPNGDDASFSFELRRVKAATLTDRAPAELQDEAEEAGARVKETIDALYSAAFVDRSAWGSYDDAFALFDGSAAERAQADVDVITLGSSAPEEYRELASPAGTVTIVVLTDRRDAPVSAIARVDFHADAELDAGGANRITSRGAYFLHPTGDGWRIFAYSIDRDEEPTASASPTGTAS